MKMKNKMWFNLWWKIGLPLNNLFYFLEGSLISLFFNLLNTLIPQLVCPLVFGAWLLTAISSSYLGVTSANLFCLGLFVMLKFGPFSFMFTLAPLRGRSCIKFTITSAGGSAVPILFIYSSISSKWMPKSEEIALLSLFLLCM